MADAVVYALLAPPAPARRHLVVAFTNGEENLSLADPANLPAVASRSDIVLDLVLPFSPDPQQPAAAPSMVLGAGATRQVFLPEAVAGTGGAAYYLDRNRDVAGIFRDLFSEFRQSYVLRYTVSGVPRGGWHDVSVRIVAPDAAKYTVRARRGYFGG